MASNDMDTMFRYKMSINPATIHQIGKIAELHKQVLTSGFLSRLDTAILGKLYKLILKEGILLAAVTDDSSLAGFVSFSHDTKKLMRMFVKSSPDIYLRLFITYLRHPSFVLRSLETMLAPFKHGNNNKGIRNIPASELLSIVVNPAVQHTGTGTALLQKLEGELKKRKIYSYKVVAGEQLISANRFYQKNEFLLTDRIRIHGKTMSNVFVKSLSID
ncbi:MAG: N-acetyltransferase [Alphaproteobacteria bacterium]|nr:N-acetyltransferase [Alphaproteobacteria bacterium]